MRWPQSVHRSAIARAGLPSGVEGRLGRHPAPEFRRLPRISAPFAPVPAPVFPGLSFQQNGAKTLCATPSRLPVRAGFWQRAARPLQPARATVRPNCIRLSIRRKSGPKVNARAPIGIVRRAGRCRRVAAVSENVTDEAALGKASRCGHGLEARALAGIQRFAIVGGSVTI
jgi:hypothetical protein